MTATPTRPVAAEGALADDVLQAARQVVEDYSAQFDVYTGPSPWQGCGVKNEPLLTLLDQLIGAIEPLAAAIADNAWDDSCPVPAAGAKGLAEALHRIADTITAAASAPDSTGWSLPSCTGKELV
jgi:hypothetical protein